MKAKRRLFITGGLGRIGLVVAKLLIERDITPTEAIRQVRIARPGTIEKIFQEIHLDNMGNGMNR